MDPKEHPIRKMREERRMLLKEVAEVLGVNPSSVGKWELEYPPKMSFKNRIKFEKHFGFDPVRKYQEIEDETDL